MLSRLKCCRGVRIRLVLAALFILQFLFVVAVFRSKQAIVAKAELFGLIDHPHVDHISSSSIPVPGKSNNSLTRILNTANVKTTVKAVKQSTKKANVVDMVNDYVPFIDFKFVFPEVIPVIEGARDLFLIILVNSAAKGNECRQRRDNIRKTWGSLTNCEQLKANNTNVGHLKWKLVFVLGKAGEGTDDILNAEEAKQHNDILIGNIDDNYLNNIIKFYMGQLWAATFTAKYTLKADDDVYLRIPGIIEYLSNEKFPSSFYGGETYPNTGVARWPGGKWSISKKYFPENMWPPFNAGAFIIISTDLLEKLFNYVYQRKPFHTDDAYIGVAMRDLKVKVTHILSFDIKNDMAQLIRRKNNCEILALIAYGHSIDPESSRVLHGRLESMCSRNITSTSC